jgi:hypothetical protein
MDRMAPSRICSRTAEVGGAVLRKRHPRLMVRSAQIAPPHPKKFDTALMPDRFAKTNVA